MNPASPQSPPKPAKTPEKGPVAAKPAAKPLKGAPPALPKLPPLFRRIDWLAMLICLAVVETIYISTLAPELGLEDSGELLTGSFWAGIPHPPGYPFWAIYSWLWTELVPFRECGVPRGVGTGGGDGVRLLADRADGVAGQQHVDGGHRGIERAGRQMGERDMRGVRGDGGVADGAG